MRRSASLRKATSSDGGGEGGREGWVSEAKEENDGEEGVGIETARRQGAV
jgi:hypothetical protein